MTDNVTTLDPHGIKRALNVIENGMEDQKQICRLNAKLRIEFYQELLAGGMEEDHALYLTGQYDPLRVT